MHGEKAWPSKVKHMLGVAEYSRAYSIWWQSIAEHGNVPIRDHLPAIHPACQPTRRSGRQKRKDFKMKAKLYILTGRTHGKLDSEFKYKYKFFFQHLF